MEFLKLILKLVGKPFKKIWSFLREVRAEFSKVVWPTRKEAIGATIAVIIFSLVVSLYLGALDYLFSKGLSYLLTKFK
ncbi:preprotein translocase subunit SecE [bacterium (Candidatus Howlettbacteria) CG_4_10_14_3_um_filter_37_10]|nr:MAG: preprotein translocase subunit SecE [bacterium (Candidatus Howlettbacteria) CG23_combo_of_CG06-09_8_20_14_all_37_9]PIX99770.1 MAG: preprotein translocase subunit SecE [bacterium (Candidatus Howlettbacteria) CG_4_10_14_3_um_filter_37_10]PJB06733.1 MAG: preprotein translocase subunit SecE [bacterium (Candidatus Howlettbacteria) CG_4_9_14_3_um_filter_37_10]